MSYRLLQEPIGIFTQHCHWGRAVENSIFFFGLFAYFLRKNPQNELSSLSLSVACFKETIEENATKLSIDDDGNDDDAVWNWLSSTCEFEFVMKGAGGNLWNSSIGVGEIDREAQGVCQLSAIVLIVVVVVVARGVCQRRR